jgi:hypothetical protein
VKTMKSSTESLWNSVFAASSIALVLAIGFAILAPKISPIGVNPYSRARNDDSATRLIDSAGKRIQSKLWNLDSQELGASVLNSIGAISEKNHVQLSDFTIENVVRVGAQREAPFVVVVDGDYAGVLKLVRDLESPDSKIGVNMLQMATSDRGLGFVRATLGVTAFLKEVP